MVYYLNNYCGLFSLCLGHPWCFPNHFLTSFNWCLFTGGELKGNSSYLRHFHL